MNKHVIMIHVSPYEIDQYQTFVQQLRKNIELIDNLDELLFVPYLNLSSYLYNWDKSWLKPEYFTNKFNKLNKIISDEIDTVVIHNKFDNKILGALSYKTEYIKKYKSIAKSFIWFDCDLWFPSNLLLGLIDSYEAVKESGYEFIITPEIVKLWDNTWDVLVNEKYINNVPSHEDYYNFDPYKLIYSSPPELYENLSNVKFASGWGNLLSAGLFDKISLDNLGHYGIDDTFVMFAMDKLNQKEKENNYRQFILRNIVVTENNLYKDNYIDETIVVRQEGSKTKEQLRQESEINMINKLKLI